MKNRLKSFLAIVIVLILCFCVGCASKKTEDKPNNTGESSETVESNVKYSKTNAIVKNGKSNYMIIVAENAGSTEVYAANELASYIKQATGAVLPIVTENKISNISTEMNLISVGNTKLMSKAGLNYSNVDFNKDGFIQKTVDRTLFLCGGESLRSHYYAIYDFLEKCLGIRFFTPECEKVPKTNSLYLPILDVVDVPAFGIRFVTYDSLMSSDFSVKSRLVTSLNNSIITEQYGEGSRAYFWGEPHSMGTTVIPHSLYGSSHPEWYYTPSDDVSGQINFIPSYGVKEDGTYDETLKENPVDIAVETLKKAMTETNEECYLYNCSQADTSALPNNAEFLKRAKKIGNSGVYIQFNNLVCERLNEWIESETRPDGLFPNGKKYKLLMFAYMITEQPPLNSNGEPAVEINENLAVWLAPIDANLLYSINDPLQDSSQTSLLESWFKCTENVCIWDYYANFYGDYNLYYTPYITTAQSAYQHYYQNGVRDYVLTQMRGHSIGPRSACPELKVYLASKLMWDPFRYNAWDLVREYCDYYYGEYSEDVLSIIYDLEDYLSVLKNDGTYRFMNHSQLNQAQFFPLNILNRGIEVVDGSLKRLNSSSLSNEEKSVMRERLEEFQCMLLSHVVFEYSSYYNGDMSGYNKTATKFFDLIYSTKWATDFFGEGVGNFKSKTFIESLENRFLPR